MVLYELACGVPPFTGAPAQVLAQHARRDAGRPGGVPDELWNLLAAMLAKHPEARPPAAAVAAELERLSPLLAALPACTPLTEPPASAPSLQPYDWAQEAATTISFSSASSPKANIASLQPYCSASFKLFNISSLLLRIMAFECSQCR